MDFRVDSGRICQSHRTEEGYLRLYGRIAKADHPMIYRSAIGGTRTETIPAAALFNADSLETFQALPVTMEHPACRYVDSANFAQFGKGSTHPSFVREVTPFGTFLGQVMTIYDKDLADRVEGGELAGLSPGYKTDTKQIGESAFEQFNRRGNHTAVVASPRGGVEVGVQLAGLRSDAEDAEIWICDSEDVFPGETADWVTELLKSGRIDGGLLEKTTVNLDRIDGRKKKGKKLCTACSEQCDCDECKKKREGRAVMADGLTLDSVQEAVDNAIAVAEEQRRVDAAWDELKTRVEQLEGEIEEKDRLLAEAADLLEGFSNDAEDEDDEDSEEIVFDSIEDFANTVYEAAKAFMEMRSDSALLGVDLVSVCGGEREAMKAFLTGAQDMKAEIIQRLNPSVRADTLDNGDFVEALYEMAMNPIRQQAEQNNDRRADSTPNWATALQAVGQVASPSSTKARPRTLADAFDDYKQGA